jgi:hypothetical protein
MRVHILGSGSEGNAIVLESEHQRILVDAGFGVRELARRLKSIDVAPESVTRWSSPTSTLITFVERVRPPGGGIGRCMRRRGRFA